MKKRKNKIQCSGNHDLNNPDHTLFVSNLKTMSLPKKTYATCKICHNSFTFTEENNKYILEEERSWT